MKFKEFKQMIQRLRKRNDDENDKKKLFNIKKKGERIFQQ